MKRLTTTVLRNSAFGLISSVLIKVLSFAFSVLIVRRLGAQDYGQYSAVLAFGATFAIFSDLGLSSYGVRQVARWRDLPDWLERSQDLFANIVALRLMLSVFTAILVISTALITRRPALIVGAIAINSLSLFLYAFEGANESLLAGFERLDAISSIKVFSQLFFVTVGGVALVTGAGYYGLIFANLGALLLLTVFCWRNLTKFGIRFKRPGPETWLKLLRASLPFGILGLALGLSYKLDSVLLSIYRSDTEVGLYNAAYNLVFTAVVFSNVVNTSLFPSLTRHTATDPEQMPRISERVFRYLILISLPIAAGGWALGGELVDFLYTKDYSAAVPAFQIVVWVIPLMYISEFLGYVILIKDKESSIARAVVISSTFNGLANLFLVPRFGFIAASVMTVATEVILLGQYFWLLRDLLHLYNWIHSLLMPMLATAVMVAVVLLLRGRIPLIVDVLVGAGVYGAGLILTRVVGADELRLFRSVLHLSNAEGMD